MVFDRVLEALSLKPVDRIPLLGLPGGDLERTYSVDRRDPFAVYRFFDVDLVYVEGQKDDEDKGIAREGAGLFGDQEQGACQLLPGVGG
jgi:hypothetical protein